MPAARSIPARRAGLDLDAVIAEAAARGAAGAPEAAIELLSRAIATHPRVATLWAFRGRMWRLAGRIDRAATDLSHAIALDRRDPFPAAQLSWIEWVRGERRAAKARLRRLARRHPRYHWAPAYLAQQHLVSGQPRAAARAIRRALALAPACTYSRRIHADLLAQGGHHRRALAELDALVEITADPYVHAERALVLGHLGDLRGAVAALDRALAVVPGLRHFWRDRAALHILLGDHGRAIADCERAIAASSEREPNLAYRLAQLHHQLADPAAVVRALAMVRATRARRSDLVARLGPVAVPRWTPATLLARAGIMEPPGVPLA